MQKRSLADSGFQPKRDKRTRKQQFLSEMDKALHDIPLLRDFARLDAFDDYLPDETTILRFRHLLEKHNLAEAIFNEAQEPCCSNTIYCLNKAQSLMLR